MAFKDSKNMGRPLTLIESIAKDVERTRNARSEAARNSDMMTIGTAGPGRPLMPRKAGFNRKMDGKGSEYRPGIEVPAVEESLYTEDDLG
jgi:hypothetical protein